mmetsp:Transcript_11484/g.32568  ORF Transcript_11484/g.32568 Transcript_11484/m.32568 type:complete len:262 (+) Transcript_11484:2251-3036(+)
METVLGGGRTRLLGGRGGPAALVGLMGGDFRGQLCADLCLSHIPTGSGVQQHVAEDSGQVATLGAGQLDSREETFLDEAATLCPGVGLVVAGAALGKAVALREGGEEFFEGLIVHSPARLHADVYALPQGGGGLFEEHGFWRKIPATCWMGRLRCSRRRNRSRGGEVSRELLRCRRQAGAFNLKGHSKGTSKGGGQVATGEQAEARLSKGRCRHIASGGLKASLGEGGGAAAAAQTRGIGVVGNWGVSVLQAPQPRPLRAR